jgi:hypothetical protein
MDFVRIYPLLRALVYSWLTLAALLLAGIAIYAYIHPMFGIILINVVVSIAFWRYVKWLRAKQEALVFFHKMGLDSAKIEPPNS